MKERPSKTWLCSVVFLDIARYTQNPVARQLTLKEQLERHIANAVADVATSNRIIVDTGDGAALCFLSDPEEALFAALSLREALFTDAAEGAGGLRVRIGINLGPIKVVKSLNGQLNPLGDGINKAQRVMAFAAPNQILVSRSFYDVIACLSEEYAQLFHYLGIRKDKHVREYPLYEVVVPGQPDTATRTLLTRVVEQADSTEIAMAAGWDPAALESVSNELATYIGPLAKVLVKKALKKTRSVSELYRLLADSIPMENGKQDFLGKAADRPAAAHALSGVPPAAETRPPSITTTPPLSDPVVLGQIEEHLAEYLGPLARVLVRQAARQATSIEELCQRLGDEITAPEQRATFLEAVGRLSVTV